MFQLPFCNWCGGRDRLASQVLKLFFDTTRSQKRM